MIQHFLLLKLQNGTEVGLLASRSQKPLTQVTSFLNKIQRPKKLCDKLDKNTKFQQKIQPQKSMSKIAILVQRRVQ